MVTYKLLANLSKFLPELIILLAMLGNLLLGAFQNKRSESSGYSYVSSLMALLIALFVLLSQYGMKGTEVFYGAYVIDSFSIFLKVLMVIGAIFVLYLASSSKEIYSYLKPEFCALSMGILFGGMLLLSANNLLIFYIGIETLSILSYAMASFKRNEAKSIEAGLKYILYGAISSGIMLFGMSHLYGIFHTLDFGLMAKSMNLVSSGGMILLAPALLCFLGGLAYKMGAAPFHMWSPDVYEGSPTPVTCFFAIVPKIAALGALARFTQLMFQESGLLQDIWVHALTVMAVLSMFIGNISALGQNSLKRMLAYSSIAHVGYMLLTILVLNEVGMASLLFYALTYIFMTLVAFGAVSFLNSHYGNDYFPRLNGFIYRYPFIGVVLGIAFLSLAGIPPLSGFVAKYSVINALISKKMYGLCVILAINSVISLYYYMRPIRLMVFGAQDCHDKIENFSITTYVYFIILVIPIFLLGICWGGFIELAGSSMLFAIN